MRHDIVLHGALGARFGERFTLDVASAREAARALIMQIKGFREHLLEGSYRVLVRRAERAFALDEGTLAIGLGLDAEVHFVPVIAGAGGSSNARYTGKVVAGAALVAIALTAGALAPAGAGFLGLGATLAGTPVTAGMVAAVGIAVALSGIAGLLTKADQSSSSFIFSGQDNVTTQGGPVPIVCGNFITGGVIISAGLQAYDLVVGSPSALAFDPSTAPNVSYYSTDG